MSLDLQRRLARFIRRHCISARKRQDTMIALHLMQWEVFAQADTILAYASVDDEADTRAIIATALAMGKRVALPRCLGKGQMHAHLITSLAQCVPGCYNIPEPPASAPVVPLAEIDLILVPGLRFDKRGGRLGQGGGYYDRYLAGWQGMTCALAYGCQVASRPLRVQPHDVPMRALATHKGIQIMW